jgi:hypothetical protein
MPIAANVHVIRGGGPALLICGIVLFTVGAIIFLRAATFQKRVSLSPDQPTEPPGPVKTGTNRFIGAVFGLFGLGLLIGGILILA